MSLTWRERLQDRYHTVGHPICLGLDPVLERIRLAIQPVPESDLLKNLPPVQTPVTPATGYRWESKPPTASETELLIVTYLGSILRGLIEADLAPAAVKPNIAFFEQYGMAGLNALSQVLQLARSYQIPVLLDAKRGDIGKTARAYARAVFDVWQADAVTVAPYLGRDAILPFVEAGGPERGVYLLVRTSNPSAADLQNLKLKNGAPLFLYVAKYLHSAFPGTGAVVGATDLQALGQLAPALRGHPLLIPGIGSQGGRVDEVLALLDPAQRSISLLSASSSVLYAYERHQKPSQYVACAVEAMREFVQAARGVTSG